MAPAPDYATLEAEKMRFLEANEMLRNLGHEVVCDVESRTELTRFRAGETLYDPAAPKEVLYFVKQGRVRIMRLTVGGKRLLLHEAGPGSFVGEMGLLGQRMSDNHAIAADDSLVCLMTRHTVVELLMTYPAVAIRYAESLTERLAEAHAALEGIAYERLEARIADILLRTGRHDGQRVMRQPRQELAETVGAARESVSRVLRRMSDSGLIQRDAEGIVILDRPGLEALLHSPGEPSRARDR